MQTISIKNNTFFYSFEIKKRKTIQLKLIKPYTILLTSPTGIDNDSIRTILLDKSSWLIKHNEAFLNNQKNIHLLENKIMFMGNEYKLSYENVHYIIFSGDNLILPSSYKNKSSVILKKWLIKQATSILAEKTNYWSIQMMVTPKQIKLKDQKTRWGSCSSKGNVNYNWRIIMAPENIIDYLIIHELSHLRVPNHSASFWSLVESFDANYKINRQWLKDHGLTLTNILK